MLKLFCSQALTLMKARKWGGKEDAAQLVADMQKYAAGVAPFDAAYGGPGFNPITWYVLFLLKMVQANLSE